MTDTRQDGGAALDHRHVLWQPFYRKLKDRDPVLYRKAIQYGEGVSINHNLSHKAAAELEFSMVCLALDALDQADALLSERGKP